MREVHDRNGSSLKTVDHEAELPRTRIMSSASPTRATPARPRQSREVATSRLRLAAARAPMAVRLLDAEPDLAAALPEAERDHARVSVILPALVLEPGQWHESAIAQAPGVRGPVLGFLVLDGALTRDVGMARRSSSRLIAAGDIVLLDEEDIDWMPARWAWSVLAPTRVAILDDRLLRHGQRWPRLISAVITRAAQQTRRAHLHQVIGQFPRVEDRLLALLWSIADQIGVARPTDVWIPLPLTHQALGTMIGARRPTVSVAVKALTEQGLVTREKTGWSLDRRSFGRLLHPD